MHCTTSIVGIAPHGEAHERESEAFGDVGECHTRHFDAHWLIRIDSNQYNAMQCNEGGGSSTKMGDDVWMGINEGASSRGRTNSG